MIDSTWLSDIQIPQGIFWGGFRPFSVLGNSPKDWKGNLLGLPVVSQK